MGTGLTVQRNLNYYNAKDYNAQGNGTTDDTTAIQAALNAAQTNGGCVFIPIGTYLITSPLVIYSNTTLIVDQGAPINLQAGSNCNMLKNAASIPSRTVTDAATTAGSATVTSATANFTAGDIGKAVGVLGAGPNYGLSSAPGSLYGTISSVTNSTTIVLSSAATLAVTNATLNVYPARDSNISVIGGIWNQGNKDSISQTLNSVAFFFRRADRLLISQMQHISTGSNAIGGRYAINIGDCTKVLAEKLDFSTAADGVHFVGPGQWITVRGLTGTTGDDMCAFTGTDGQSVAGSLLGDVYGNFTDVLVEDIKPNGSWTALKVAAGIGSNNVANTISRFKAKDISGTSISTSGGMVNIADYAGNTNVSCEIENVTGTTGSNQPLVKLAASSALEIVLSGVKWPNSAPPTNGVIQITNGPTAVLIKNLEFLYGGSAGVPIVLCSASFIRHLTIDGFSAANGPTGAVDLLRFTTASTSISLLRIMNVFRAGTSGSGNIIACTASNYNLKAIVNDISIWSGGIFGATADSTNTLFLTATNLQTGSASNAATLCTLQSPATLYLANVFHTTTAAAAIVANDTAATPIRVYGQNITLSSGALFSRSATQSISGTGLTVTADLSILTPTDQDIVNNTNGALSCGAGLCIFHTGGTGNGWKNLYSGATY